MGTANRAYGTQMFPALPFHGVGAGYTTEFGHILPPGGKVQAYVRSTGVQDSDPYEIKKRLYTDINSALALCRSGFHDAVIVLPGHAENVDSADDWDNLVAGTQIIGCGRGNLRPTFTWSTATSTVLFDVANVTLSNCVLEMAGDPASSTALTVAAPITVSAAGCTIDGCRIQTEIDADQGSTIAITTTAAGDDFTISNCHIHGDGDGTLPTTLIQLVGADRFKMLNTVVRGFTSAVTVGVMRLLTTASTDIIVDNCVFYNQTASSQIAVNGLAASSGVVSNCHFVYLDTGTANGLTGWSTKANISFHKCTTANTAGEAGGETSIVSA